MTERELIGMCCNRIEEELQWGPSERWTNQDFGKLSELIFQKTNITLSVSTLKRIWGKVSYPNLPSASTLNALAMYTGHKSWQDLWQQKKVHKKADEPLTAKTDIRTKKWWERPQVRKAVFMLVLIGLGIIVFFIFS